MIRCVVSGCGAMASTDATKRSMGTAPVDAPMACGSPPLPGGGQSKLCRMVGDANLLLTVMPTCCRWPVETFAGYRQLDADGVGGSSMESQSRGSTHVHSMIFRDSYRQGIAGSRHAETLAMGGMLNEPTEKRTSKVLLPQKCYRPPSPGGGAGDSVQ